MRTVLALSAALLFVSSPAKSGIFGDFLEGYIDGVTIGGAIRGDSAAVVGGMVIGGALDSMKGGPRNKDPDRNRYYSDRRHDPVSEPEKRPSPNSASALVVEIQLSLRRLGYNPGPADGVAGQATGKAVQSYKSKHGLPQDNKITQELLNHMRSNGG